jgi:hypothetical protein
VRRRNAFRPFVDGLENRFYPSTIMVPALVDDSDPPPAPEPPLPPYPGDNPPLDPPLVLLS